jgi:hypothetical protein
MGSNSGFLQTSSGENSSTKLFNTIYGVVLIVIWAALCWDKKELIPFDPTVFVPMGIGQGLNTVNKWIEVNGNADKAKFIKAIMTKVQK